MINYIPVIRFLKFYNCDHIVLFVYIILFSVGVNCSLCASTSIMSNECKPTITGVWLFTLNAFISPNIHLNFGMHILLVTPLSC